MEQVVCIMVSFDIHLYTFIVKLNLNILFTCVILYIYMHRTCATVAIF